MATISNLATGDLITEAFMDSLTTALNRVSCSVSRAAAQSIPSGTGTFTAISWDTEASDSFGFITATSDTFTVPTGYDGVYAIVPVVTWASSPGANSCIDVLVNGATGYGRTPIGAGTQMLVVGTTTVIPLAVADTVKVRLSQASGGAINITGTCLVLRLAL